MGNNFTKRKIEQMLNTARVRRINQDIQVVKEYLIKDNLHPEFKLFLTETLEKLEGKKEDVLNH